MDQQAPTLAALVLAVGATYAAVGTGAWEWHMHWDDRENFVANPLVRQLDWRSLATPVLGVFEPISLLAKRAEYQLFGLDIQAYLAASVALHCVNCLLLCRRQVPLR